MTMGPTGGRHLKAGFQFEKQPFWLRPFWLKPFVFKRCVGGTHDELSLHAPQGMEYSGGPRRVVAGHPWTATSIDEVASSEASLSEAEFECCSSTTRDHFPVESVGCAPEEVSSRGPCASTKILRIQAAVATLGPDDAEERATLETALARSRQLAVVPPVDKRIADTDAFIARAQKRVAEAAKILEAEKQKQLLEEELAQAEKDLEGFRREAENVPGQWRVAKSQWTPCHRWRPSLRESEQSWLS